MEDRISALPDDLIQIILSFLNVEDAVPTSVLSKRWRYQWTFSSNLCYGGDAELLSSAIDGCMMRYQLNQLDKLCFETELLNVELPRIRRWLEFAVEKRVSTLKIKGDSSQPGGFTLPEVVFSNPNLKSLTLTNCHLPFPSDIKCFDSLTHLSLHEVDDYDGVFDSIISKCRLQTLEYTKRMCSKLDNVFIFLPDLREISIYLECQVLSICVPKVQVLAIHGLIEKLNVWGSPSIKEARFGFKEVCEDPPVELGRHLVSNIHLISDVKSLLITEAVFKIYTDYSLDGARVVFKNLKVLRLEDIIELETVHSFVRFFRDCPFLEELNIHFFLPGKYHKVDDGVVDGDVLKLTTEFGNYFLTHLKVVDISYFTFSPKKVLLLKFLLESSTVLENMYVHVFEISQDQQQMLLQLPKVSPDAKMMLFDSLE